MLLLKVMLGLGRLQIKHVVEQLRVQNSSEQPRSAEQGADLGFKTHDLGGGAMISVGFLGFEFTI